MILFVDMDGVVFEQGTDMFLPGTIGKLKELQKTWQLVAFTCRPPGAWMQKLADAGLRFEGYLHKPLAEKYGYVDDKLELASCGVKL